MHRIVLIVHDVRSAHNVGSILRSADGFNVNCVYLTGYTPYPAMANDKRLPHIARRASEQIAKTALGAEKTLKWQHRSDIFELISRLKKEGYLLAALEQTDQALRLPEFKAKDNIALIVGSEIGGIKSDLLKAVDIHLVIPMLGGKESFNVSVASAVALYHLRWHKL
ncbi:TrmH family RNA methyltransferase [Candidatus Saccharibacteria bacterium]|nr:TrmH family RNA methyltransferase [Candidatus Saccharibacteria bacterium]MBI2285435.1 TrmH family RNA methyltransferase [Candidatus Saccharibacteria bacterium]